MKNRRVLCLLLVVGILLLSLISCSGNKRKDDIVGKPAGYCFDASLKIDKETVNKDVPIDITNEQLRATLSIENKNNSNYMSVIMFSNGLPIEFEVNNMIYTHFTFEATTKTNIDFVVNSNQFVSGETNYDIVLIMQESLELLHSRDDEKNYSFSMNYVINNRSDVCRATNDITFLDATYYTYEDYFNMCYDSKKQNNMLDKEHDYELENISFNNLVSDQELDICFTNLIQNGQPTNMSVKRNIVKNINSNEGKIQLRICGQPGNYMLTMFERTGKYAGFDGRETVCITVKENCFTYIEVDYPPYINQNESCIYALAVSCDEKERRVFDSGLLNVYFSENNVDLTYNYTESMLNLYYQNELINPNIEDQIFDYKGGEVEFRFVFGEITTSFINNYWLIITVDGIQQKYHVNDQDAVYMYSFNTADGTEEAIIRVQPSAINTNEYFNISCFIIPATLSNPISPASFVNLDSCMMSEIRFRAKAPLNDISNEIFYLDEGAETSNTIKSDYVINLHDEGFTNGNLIEMAGLKNCKLYASMTSENSDVSGLSCLIVNGNIVPHEGKPFVKWFIHSNERKDILLDIPEQYLHYGMNEIYFLTSIANHCSLNRKNIYVYRNSNQINDYSISDSNGAITFDLTQSYINPNVSTRVYISTTTETGYFGNFFNYVTARHLRTDTTGCVIYEFGDADSNQLMLLSAIITTESYSNGIYSFSRTKTIKNIS